MEKKQYELCLEILRRFNKAGILNDLILIGSWSAYFYKDYFSGVPYLKNISLKTRDMDFFVYDTARIKKEVNIPALLKDLGFVIDFEGANRKRRIE